MRLETFDDNSKLRIIWERKDRGFGKRRKLAIAKIAAIAIQDMLEQRLASGGKDQNWPRLRMPDQARDDTPLKTLIYKVTAPNQQGFEIGAKQKRIAAIHDVGVESITPRKHHALFIPLTAKAKRATRTGSNIPVKSYMKAFRNPETGKVEMRPTSPRRFMAITEHIKGQKRGTITQRELIPGRVKGDKGTTPLQFEASREIDRRKGRKPDFTFFQQVKLPQRRQYVITGQNLRELKQILQQSVR